MSDNDTDKNSVKNENENKNETENGKEDIDIIDQIEVNSIIYESFIISLITFYVQYATFDCYAGLSSRVYFNSGNHSLPPKTDHSKGVRIIKNLIIFTPLLWSVLGGNEWLPELKYTRDDNPA